MKKNKQAAEQTANVRDIRKYYPDTQKRYLGYEERARYSPVLSGYSKEYLGYLGIPRVSTVCLLPPPQRGHARSPPISSLRVASSRSFTFLGSVGGSIS
jgi:hypothetical protein